MLFRSVDGVVDDEHTLAGSDVDSVAVLCVPWAAYCHSVNDYVLTVVWSEVELGRILQCYALYHYPLAVGEAYHVDAHLFLLFHGGGYVALMFEVERVPKVALFRHGTAEFEANLSSSSATLMPSSSLKSGFM